MTRRALVASYGAPQHDRDSGSRRIRDHADMLRADGWEVVFLGSNHRGEPDYVRALERDGVAVRSFDDVDVTRLIAEGGFGVAVISFWPVAELLLPVLRELSPTTRVIVDSVDLHFLRLARRRFAAVDGLAGGRLLGSDHADELVAELNVYAAADVVISVSAKEAALLDDILAASVPSLTVPDVEDLDRSPVALADRRGVQFIGSFRHEPNVQAIAWLCSDIWPRVRHGSAHPLSVVGDGMTADIAAMVSATLNADAVGWVPSVTPYLGGARASVIPLTYGAGTKRKLLQALMIGTPTVSTSVGIEGLGLVDGEHVLIADDAAAFAAAVDRLLVDDDLWAQLAAAGREAVLVRHGRPAAAVALRQAVDLALARPSNPRRLPLGGPQRYHDRLVSQDRSRRNARLHDLVLTSTTPGATVAVVSKGDPELICLDGRTGWHFPRLVDGTYAGHHPGTGAEAVAAVEDARRSGARYLVFPDWARWWLDHYVELRDHLAATARIAADDPDAGVVWALDGVAPTASEHWNVHDRPAAPVVDAEPAARLVAFLLPQFHPIPENDRWWGPGFTEWTNVAKARPLFSGHEQPRQPADLGYYDLRLAETRAAQAALAAEHGIAAFCWYHYWFGGTRLLERPFEEVLASGSPPFPFVLCWANEPWSRRWDGSSASVLQAQSYSAEDDVAHIRSLLPAFADPRAFTVDGRPMFLVYRADELPDPARTTDVWRREVSAAGLGDLHLVAVETGWDEGWDATTVGFDAKVAFQPQFTILRRDVPRLEVHDEGPQVHRYDDAWPVLSELAPVPYRRYDCVAPSWDNTARTGRRGVVLHGSTPAAYEQWLARAVARVQSEPPEQRIVFLNAWNEWAEGCYLEPDARHGRGYLEATRRVVLERSGALVTQ